jgi:hypothetical protein
LFVFGLGFVRFSPLLQVFVNAFNEFILGCTSSWRQGGTEPACSSAGRHGFLLGLLFSV